MRQVRHKLLLLYPAGIISLLLLPLLGAVYLINTQGFRLRVMEINLWDESAYVNGAYNGYPLGFRLHPEREFIEINLTGNQEQDRRMLDFAQLKVREIVQAIDTIRGVHFHFENTSKFGSYIRALDICFREKSKTFVPHEDDIWMFCYVPKPQPPQKPYAGICGGNCIPGDVEEKPVTKASAVSLTQAWCLPALLYLTLAGLALINLLKFLLSR